MVGILRLSDENGLQFSVSGQAETLWWEGLPGAFEWPGLTRIPDQPKPQRPQPFSRHESIEQKKLRWAADKTAKDEWTRARDLYWQTLHADPSYKKAALEFLARQRVEPHRLEINPLWAYRDKVLRVDSNEPETLRDEKTDALLIKHYVLRRERNYEKVQREVEALENLEKLDTVTREPIPESVRLFVWQRDKGQCVKCAARERLEFDHIIPVVAGGSNTERNIQLLCETCNRSKGSTI
jgi:5-methylcytosine-specific restriction endonuclease McrA